MALLRSGPVGRHEHVDGQRLVPGHCRRLGHRHDRRPVPGAEPAGRVNVAVQPCACDVEPGEEPQRLAGRVVEVAGPVLLGEAEQDGFDEVRVGVADVGEDVGFDAVQEGVIVEDQEVAQVPPVGVGVEAASTPV